MEPENSVVPARMNGTPQRLAWIGCWLMAKRATARARTAVISLQVGERCIAALQIHGQTAEQRDPRRSASAKSSGDHLPPFMMA